MDKPRCRVLIENPHLRVLVRLILSLEGWDVTEADDPALPSVAVIADLDCFIWPADHVGQAVRHAAGAGLPVLALTGQDLSLGDRTALGNPRVLAKPFELPAFVGVLHDWSRRRPPLSADAA